MLQPPQLQDVSHRYPQAINELRDFLAKTGLSLDTPETLQHVSTLLHEDRTFRRDLTSHIWVAIHASKRQISYPDLLGILTIAAVGTAFAAEADEAEAHDLLRFLMEARGSFDAAPPAAPRTPLPWPTEPAVRPPDARPVRAPEPHAPPALTAVTTSAEEEPVEEETTDHRPLILGATVGALLLLLIGIWWHYRPAPASSTAALATHTSGLTTETSATTPPPVVIAAPPAPTPVATSTPRHHTPPAARTARSVRPIYPAFSPLPPDPAPEDTTAAALPALTPAAPRPTAPRPPANWEDHVRHPQPAVADDANTGTSTPPPATTATARPPAVRPLLTRPHPGATTSTANVPTVTHNPTVLPTSLGIMAANVVYSPAPAYPTAASAANVQGEVKVEAEIDRDGNVTAARVISGPPLLREATVDAIEHWRYRPYLAGGKPIGMNAIVVMDYQLN